MVEAEGNTLWGKGHEALQISGTNANRPALSNQFPRLLQRVVTTTTAFIPRQISCELRRTSNKSQQVLPPVPIKGVTLRPGSLTEHVQYYPPSTGETLQCFVDISSYVTKIAISQSSEKSAKGHLAPPRTSPYVDSSYG